MKKTCSKCGGDLNCMSNSIQQCHCSRFTFSKIELKAINENWKDCLCFSCLSELSKRFD
ncbi:MAG: cysteine-rich CWC family protein [Flavobacteriaceae bacterium]|nr:cysteine-rich CWC family protein [Flavobacteriaceae bacterium]